MKEENLTLYNKNKIAKLVSNLLGYYDESEYKKEIIKASHLLMDKVRYCDIDDITLEADFIEEILFTLNEDGTKSIVSDVFFNLRSVNADLLGVSFDNVHVKGFYFNGLRNVEIDIQKIPNYDISKTCLEGVKVKGTLDEANIEGTNFTGYIGNLILNPQLVQNKNLSFTNINGVTVNGSFDGVNVSSMKTKGFKGEIIINPQKVIDKELWNIDFNGIKLVGDYNDKTKTYNDPCFDGCRLYSNNFKGCIGNVIIPLDKLHNEAMLCNFTGVKLTGLTKDRDTFCLEYCYYEDENNKKIYLIDCIDKSELVEETSSEEKIESHKTKTRSKNIFNRIFGTSKK